MTIVWIFPLFDLYLRLLLSIGRSISTILRFPLKYIGTPMPTLRSILWYNSLRCFKRTRGFIGLLFNISWLLIPTIFVHFRFDLIMSLNWNRLILINDLSLWFIFHFRWSWMITFPLNRCGFWWWGVMLMLRLLLMFLMFTWWYAISLFWLLYFLLGLFQSIFFNSFLSFLLHFFYLLFS